MGYPALCISTLLPGVIAGHEHGVWMRHVRCRLGGAGCADYLKVPSTGVHCNSGGDEGKKGGHRE